jgi:hypothetical protein
LWSSSTSKFFTLGCLVLALEENLESQF